MRSRLLIGFLGLITVVLAVQFIPLTNYFSAIESDRIIKILQRDAFVIAAKSEETLEEIENTDFSYVSKVVSDYRSQGGARVVVTDKDGVAVATSDTNEGAIGASYLSRPEVASALGGNIAVGQRFSNTLGYELFFVSVPVFQSDNVVGVVRLTFPVSVIDGEVRDRVWGLFWIGIVTLLLTAFLAVVLSRQLTRNLNLLKQGVQRFADGDLEARVDLHTGDPETQKLGQAFDAMALKIENLVSEQKNFAADASHQLRTPLTALSLRLEEAEAAIETSPEAAKHQITESIKETHRLGRIIEGLLALSRIDSSKLVFETYDLRAFISGRVEMWEPLLDELEIKFNIGQVPAVSVKALQGALEQVFDNLIDNALKFSKAGDVLRVEFSVESDLVEIQISDEGPGMSAEERAEAFTRFWRGDSQKVSTGLGLAIVNRLLVASGGSISLDEADSGGLKALVRIPRN